jgi:hypothetical protein
MKKRRQAVAVLQVLEKKANAEKPITCPGVVAFHFRGRFYNDSWKNLK